MGLKALDECLGGRSGIASLLEKLIVKASPIEPVLRETERIGIVHETFDVADQRVDGGLIARLHERDRFLAERVGIGNPLVEESRLSLVQLIRLRVREQRGNLAE